MRATVPSAAGNGGMAAIQASAIGSRSCPDDGLSVNGEILATVTQIASPARIRPAPEASPAGPGARRAVEVAIAAAVRAMSAQTAALAGMVKLTTKISRPRAA